LGIQLNTLKNLTGVAISIFPDDDPLEVSGEKSKANFIGLPETGFFSSIYTLTLQRQTSLPLPLIIKRFLKGFLLPCSSLKLVYFPPSTLLH
jgi:hypothetical protein